MNLFHHSVGEDGNEREDRLIVISIYWDGLSYVPDVATATQDNHALLKLRQYRPWAVQRIPSSVNYDAIFALSTTTTESSSSSPVDGKGGGRTQISPTIATSTTTTSRTDVTRMAKSAIKALNDQPGECLRDDNDELDFEVLKDLDLSTIPKPGFGDDELLLVDTPTKMKQCIRELEVRCVPTEE